ncbi:RhoGAP-domain-containing protein [Hesseltinella vesiculosa]|uniref:RhoGAP-domain-containing protein n=1 Tax=Hesseltinella vesiculosa TaxID=101127 RepID=A0A1X2GWQ1_9FUNG|nr:RhoGAP-domain-containing protein [Hesseltinella vesiculosa]
MSTKVVPLNALPSTSGTTLDELASQNAELWGIVMKQRADIQELEQSLLRITRERDNLLRHPQGNGLNWSQQQPERLQSRFLKHPTESLDRPVIPPAPHPLFPPSVLTTSPLPNRLATDHTALLAPVHAILDNDAQLFAKYQQAEAKQVEARMQPLDDRPTSSPAPPPATFLTGKSIQAIDHTILTNTKGQEVMALILSLRISSTNEELWRLEKTHFDLLMLDHLLRRLYPSFCESLDKLPDKTVFNARSYSKIQLAMATTERYLTTLFHTPFPDSEEVVQFLSTSLHPQKRAHPSTNQDGDTNPQHTIYLPDAQLMIHRRPVAIQGAETNKTVLTISDTKRSTSRDKQSSWSPLTLLGNSEKETDEWQQALRPITTVCVPTTSHKKPATLSLPALRPSPPSSPHTNFASSSSSSSTSSIRDGFGQFTTLDQIPTKASLPHRSNSDTSLYPGKLYSQPCTGSMEETKLPVMITSSHLRQRSSVDSAMYGVQDEKKTKQKAHRRTFWPRKIFSSANPPQPTSSPTSSSASSSPLAHPHGVFRGFLSRHSSDEVSPHKESSTSTPIFGVTLDEAIRVSKISENYELPAIVYRCIEFLEMKNAVYEEGIYRLSGSALKIKTLKREFDIVGDINLVSSTSHRDCDIHAISGLLKLWFRELPDHVLTDKLYRDFLAVLNMQDQKACVQELGRLVSLLPLSNYTLLRTLCAHLHRVVQNANVNKMNLRNIGIVFSPTLGIPAGIVCLFLSEFDYIFWTENKIKPTSRPSSPEPCPPSDPVSPLSDDDLGQVPPLPRRRRVHYVHQDGRSNRNSVQYADGAPECIVGMEQGIKSIEYLHESGGGDKFQQEEEDGTFDPPAAQSPAAQSLETWKIASGTKSS